MQSVRSKLRDERGVTLALVAVSMFLFLGFAALAIDLGMVKASGAEAQRAADAAALAGASAFIDYANSGAAVIDSAAVARATDYATRQQIRTTPIVAGEVNVQVIDADFKVRVTIDRASVSTWFANTFGVSSVRVSRTAAAEATTAGVTTSCLKPFLMPDRWAESDKVNQDNSPINNNLDAVGGNNNRGEEWFYQTGGPQGGDRYEAYNPDSPSGTQTGYGSGADGDGGLRIMLKPQTGNGQRIGNFYQLLDPSAYGLPNNLKNAVETGCISTSVGDTAHTQTGGNTAVRQAVQELIAADPDVTWDATERHPTATATNPDWTRNPRVIIVGLYSPSVIATSCDVTANGQTSCNSVEPNGPIIFTNFARIFLDADPGNNDNITARFIGFLGGSGEGGSTTGPLVKVLRLVE